MEDRSSRFWSWALAGTAVAATSVAGLYAYRYLSEAAEADTGVKTVDEGEIGSRLRLVKALQMRTLSRQPMPSFAPPSKTKAAGPAVKPSMGGNSKGSKLCAECAKPLAGLPHRCSMCKVTYYCGKECQKMAWPAHKDLCKTSGASNKLTGIAQESNPNGAAAKEGTAAGTSASTVSKEAVVVSPTPPTQQAPSQDTPQSMQEALAYVLEESAAGKADRLESMFETSVMMFLREDYRGAVTQLHLVQELARSRGETAVEGEVYKWLGHCWSKLSDARRAEQYFIEGAEFALSKGLTKVQVDCLGGLGMLHRSQNDPSRAMLYLGKALEVAEQLGDLDLKAAMLCNMGSVLMQVDHEKALVVLQEAVSLREQAIETLHDSGERAGLATAVMEHATAMVNLASALYMCKKLVDAKICYERALEVFELVEDSEKVIKVLVNLANMCELQMKDVAGSKEEAAKFRERLITFLQSTGAPVPEDTCGMCQEKLHMSQPAAEGKEMIMLACMHCLHDECWNKHMAKGKEEEVACPTCSKPVAVTV